MSDKEIINVVNQSPSIRYEYFIKKVADNEQLWGLYNNGWAMAEDENHQKYMPFWPKSEFAEACANGIWEGYSPKLIKLSDFINKWIPGMKNGDVKISVFYIPNNSGVIVSHDQLLENLETELENY